MSNTNLIIGGGIAGLSWAFYHPDNLVITDKVGGQFSAPFQLGPKYLHHTPDTVKFLTDLGVIDNYKKKTIKIGFYYDHILHPYSSNENRLAYFQKTRGESSEPYRSSMSEGNNSFEAFSIGVDDLVSILEEKVRDRIIVDKVIGVDTNNRLVFGGEPYATHAFENLVVTIPRPVFYKMAGHIPFAEKFKSHPTTFVLVRPMALEKTSMSETMGYDYIYCSDTDVPFHRLTNLPDTTMVLEFKGDNVPEQPGEISRFVMNIGQLVHVQEDLKWPEFIKFFGRYAVWDHSIKTNQLLRRIYETEQS